MASTKNGFALAVLYILAFLGLFAFQMWSVSSAIIGAILIVLAITIVDKAYVNKKIDRLQSSMEARHRELTEKVGQQMLFFANEMEGTKSSISKGLFSIEGQKQPEPPQNSF